MTVLAVVLARSGSKGVPGKNLREVGGVPLVVRAVRSGIESGAVESVLVSTDDPHIRDVAVAAGAEAPFLRPPEISGDKASSLDALIHAVIMWEQVHRRTVGHVVLLEPTSPFRTGSHVCAAVERMAQGGCRAVVSVCPLERKPQNIFRKNGVLERYIRDPEETFYQRQDMEHLCRANSAVYVVGRDDLVIERTLMPLPLGYVEMTSIESINIDEELDLYLANILSSHYNL